MNLLSLDPTEDKKRVQVPVLVTLGTCRDGRRVVVDLGIAVGESARESLSRGMPHERVILSQELARGEITLDDPPRYLPIPRRPPHRTQQSRVDTRVVRAVSSSGVPGCGR